MKSAVSGVCRRHSWHVYQLRTRKEPEPESAAEPPTSEAEWHRGRDDVPVCANTRADIYAGYQDTFFSLPRGSRVDTWVPMLAPWSR